MRVLLFLLLLPSVAISQNLFWSVDKIYGDTIVRTDMWSIYDKSILGKTIRDLNVTGYKKGHRLSLIISGSQYGTDVMLYRKDKDSIFLKFTDKTIIRKPISQTDFANISYVTGNTFYAFSVALDSVDIDHILPRNLEFVRIEYSRGNMDFDVSSGSSTVLSVVLRPLLKWTGPPEERKRKRKRDR